MKITGPAGTPPEAAGGASETAGTGGANFAEKLGGSGAAERAGEARGARKAEHAGIAGDIGADLQAGRITPEAALERVIDRVLDRQIGANAPAALRERVGAALRQTLEDDPMLAEKIRALAPRR